MPKSTGVGQGVGGGRPPTFRKAFIEQARKLCKLGATDWDLADFFGVAESSIKRWKLEHAKFQAATKPGKRAANARVEVSLYRRGTGYEYDSEEIHLVDHVEERYEPAVPGAPPPEDGSPAPTVRVVTRTKQVLRVPVVKHVPPDPTSMIFWLKNRDKDHWRDFKATEISTPPGRPIRIQTDGKPEAELIGAYYARLATIAAGGDPDTHPDPGVGEGGQEPDGPGGGSEADPG